MERYIDWVRKGRGYRIKFSLCRRLEEGAQNFNFIRSSNLASSGASPLDTLDDSFCFISEKRKFAKKPPNSRKKLKTEGADLSLRYLERKVRMLQH